MKNTLAIAIIILGAMLVYGGYKNLSFADTIRYFTGQKVQGGGAIKRDSSGLDNKVPHANDSTPDSGIAPSTGGNP